MDKTNLRKADFITSLLLIAFGIFVIVESTKMPMEASYGGVDSHWYVAPALFPLFVGIVLILLGMMLLGIAIKDGGLSGIIANVRAKKRFVIDAKVYRILIVAFSLASFIYVFIPRVDFFISIATFLFYLTTVFYPESFRIRNRLTVLFVLETAIYVILMATGLWNTLIGIYVYVMDILSILFFVALVAIAFRTARIDGTDRKKIRTTFWLSLIVPAFLCPVFRFPLRTPLPHEGLILDYMNLYVFRLRHLR